MKKLLFVIGSILFLTGCSMDSALREFLFIQKNEKVVEKEEQKPNVEVPEKTNVNKEETVHPGKGKENGRINQKRV